ncbi:hypothetical protein CERSUDRAFT_49893 [Gelatoporia subvermispora B]|uniref:SGNH hydrolase-type esterase domain-containing protein n=1 Tax=Ceriporiopsis subvermispora (strain B) TaxID=914234 RepID=M2PMB5_CERS8|nr:hypothetical protein CERSUDRAFT_49893 [Gelatoporia subvermispora B]
MGAVLAVAATPAPDTVARSVSVQNNDPLIHFHGRWDPAPETWWGSTGFKLHVQDLSSLTLNLGNHTTSPTVQLGVSVNYGPFNTVNVSAGTNEIPLIVSSDETDDAKLPATSVVRINVPGWQDNRLELENIVLNPGAKLLPYTPSDIHFQFIGDSLSAGGQYLPQIVDQAWTFLTPENFKAEHLINAQPGIALSDIDAYGNVHGMSYQYFVTEDTQYYYTDYHNYTTPWNFARDQPPATHVVIHIGANDSGNNPSLTRPQTYLEFLSRLRTLYHTQPFFIFTPWGWPQPDGSISYYYPGQYETIVATRHALGDRNTFLVNTTGWVTLEDVFPGNMHPTVDGHIKIAGLFQEWLENWGLHPLSAWATPA